MGKKEIIMKQYLLKDALLVASVVLGIVSNLKSTMLIILFTGILLVYAFLRYTDKKVVIKK